MADEDKKLDVWNSYRLGVLWFVVILAAMLYVISAGIVTFIMPWYFWASIWDANHSFLFALFIIAPSYLFTAAFCGYSWLYLGRAIIRWVDKKYTDGVLNARLKSIWNSI